MHTRSLFVTRPLPCVTCVTPCVVLAQVSCITRDLEVSYDLLTPEQYSQWVAMRANPRTRKRRDDVTNFVGMGE